MEGLYLALLTLLDPGDEVLIPAPYYVNYVQMCQMCHAVPVVIDNPLADALSFNVEDLEAAITSRTKVIMINTPSNPTGRIIPRDKIEAIAEIAVRHDLVVISDEVYKSLIYECKDYRSIAAMEGMRERTVLINSLSKEFCMTGWRIGYVLGPSEVIEGMIKLQENVAACAPLPSQYAAIEALSGKEDYSSHMLEVFRQRRDILTEGIRSVPGLSCTAPEATFYLMVDISATGMKAEEFAMDLLEKNRVIVVPWHAFGATSDRYVRLSFAASEETIREGIR